MKSAVRTHDLTRNENGWKWHFKHTHTHCSHFTIHKHALYFHSRWFFHLNLGFLPQRIIEKRIFLDCIKCLTTTITENMLNCLLFCCSIKNIVDFIRSLQLLTFFWFRFMGLIQKFGITKKKERMTNITKEERRKKWQIIYWRDYSIQVAGIIICVAMARKQWKTFNFSAGKRRLSAHIYTMRCCVT